MKSVVAIEGWLREHLQEAPETVDFCRFAKAIALACGDGDSAKWLASRVETLPSSENVLQALQSVERAASDLHDALHGLPDIVITLMFGTDRCLLDPQGWSPDDHAWHRAGNLRELARATRDGAAKEATHYAPKRGKPRSRQASIHKMHEFIGVWEASGRVVTIGDFKRGGFLEFCQAILEFLDDPWSEEELRYSARQARAERRSLQR